jgi:hypothetical protein
MVTQITSSRAEVWHIYLLPKSILFLGPPQDLLLQVTLQLPKRVKNILITF